jgi:hypothetical protein
VNGYFGPDAPSIVNEQFRPWSQSTFSEVDETIDEAIVLNILDEHSSTKAGCDFKRADDTRDT